jgi:hypothetical protein
MHLIKHLPRDVLATRLESLARVRPDLAELVRSGSASFTFADGETVASIGYKSAEPQDAPFTPVVTPARTTSAPPVAAPPAVVRTAPKKGSSAGLAARIRALAAANHTPAAKKSSDRPTLRSLLG